MKPHNVNLICCFLPLINESTGEILVAPWNFRVSVGESILVILGRQTVIFPKYINHKLSYLQWLKNLRPATGQNRILLNYSSEFPCITFPYSERNSRETYGNVLRLKLFYTFFP